MVDSVLRLEVFSYWSPTRLAVQRANEMQIEFSLNQLGAMEYSVAEVAWRTGDLGEALSVVPQGMSPGSLRTMRHLLQPWPRGRYSEAYNRTGGVLNYLTPPWNTQQDEVWAEMVAQWKATSFPDDEARVQAMRDLEQAWNHRPHPFFAGLTPAQVMVGGGELERALARDFLDRLTAKFDGKGHESEGHALVQSLILLRAWQFRPQPDGRRPIDVILAERSELLARRAHILGERGQD
jgi:hypothetical protein